MQDLSNALTRDIDSAVSTKGLGSSILAQLMPRMSSLTDEVASLQSQLSALQTQQKDASGKVTALSQFFDGAQSLVGTYVLEEKDLKQCKYRVIVDCICPTGSTRVQFADVQGYDYHRSSQAFACVKSIADLVVQGLNDQISII